MLTFDADDTIYEHGMDLVKESWIVSALCTIMECGIYVAVVTAAGYFRAPHWESICLAVVAATGKHLQILHARNSMCAEVVDAAGWCCEILTVLAKDRKSQAIKTQNLKPKT